MDPNAPNQFFFFHHFKIQMAPVVKEKKARRVGKRQQKEVIEELSESAQKLNLENNRSSTGVLTSEKNSRDVKVSLALIVD